MDQSQTQVASIISDAPGIEGIERVSAEIREKLHGATPALLFVFPSMKQPLSEVLPALSARFPDSVTLGASTAGEFTEAGDTKNTLCVVAIAGDYRVFAGVGTGVSTDPEAAVRAALEGQATSMHGYSHRTAILLIDPLAGHGEETTLLAAAALGEDVVLVGGAAGDYLAMKETFVGCDRRVASNAVVIAQIFSRSPLGVGIAHGHRAISDPLTVTSAEGSVVKTLNGRPAWDVWREQTSTRAAERGIDVTKLTNEEIPGFLLRYEAGLSVGDDIKIRAPLMLLPEGAIGFACGMPTGAVFRITESEPQRQVDSARSAARQARLGLKGAEPAGAVVFDCICRNLILGERFADAVRAISEELGNRPIGGFETYGEIALSVGEMSGFHNTTSVVLAFPR